MEGTWKVGLSSLAAELRVCKDKLNDAFRPMVYKPGMLGDGQGTAYAEQGGTHVFVTVDGPRDPTTSSDVNKLQGGVVVEVEGLEEEAQRRLQSTLQGALTTLIRTERYAMMEIGIRVQVLRLEGSDTAVALLTAALALIDRGIEVWDMIVAACIAYPLDSANPIIVDPIDGQVSLSEYALVTVGLMPHLNQLVICEQIGAPLSLDQVRLAFKKADSVARRLTPFVTKAIRDGLQGNSDPGNG